jgi:hypothetical protein
MEYGTISFIDKRGQVEDTAGKRKFFLVLENGIMEFEKRMLSESGCPYTLPMHFVSDEVREIAYYDFTGFIQMEEYIKRKAALKAGERDGGKPAGDMLKLLSGILECLRGMERHLLSPERCAVHPDAVFVDPGGGRVSFAFYPGGGQGLALRERIFSLIDRMSELCYDDVTEGYLYRVKSEIDDQNHGLDGMISVLGAAQREVGYIYWNTASFRKEEGSGAPMKHDAGDQEVPVRKKSAFPKARVFPKVIAVQAFFAALLAVVFLAGRLDGSGFAGLVIIAAGADAGILRRILKK